MTGASTTGIHLEKDSRLGGLSSHGEATTTLVNDARETFPTLSYTGEWMTATFARSGDGSERSCSSLCGCGEWTVCRGLTRFTRGSAFP